jgi:hypothetical protein
MNKTIIILRDFNVDMLRNSAIKRELENYMCNYNLRFLLVKIKHLQNTLIDHVVDTERGVNQYQVQFKIFFQLILKPFNYIQ